MGRRHRDAVSGKKAGRNAGIELVEYDGELLTAGPVEEDDSLGAAIPDDQASFRPG